jgi:transcriptional regulator with XRE-family HTH domain
MRTPKRQRGRLFLREWREFRQLSQDALASRIGKTQGLISQLENAKVNYTGALLEALADALRCEPADLIMRNPQDPEAPWSIWDRLRAVERKEVIDFLKQRFPQKKAAAG